MGRSLAALGMTTVKILLVNQPVMGEKGERVVVFDVVVGYRYQDIHKICGVLSVLLYRYYYKMVGVYS